MFSTHLALAKFLPVFTIDYRVCSNRTPGRKWGVSMNELARGRAGTEFVLNELMKTAAYAKLSEEDRGAIAVAVAYISAKFYLDGCNRDRRGEGVAHRHWFKGCWVGSEWPGSFVNAGP